MNLVLNSLEQGIIDALHQLHERSRYWSEDKSKAAEYTREVKRAIGGVGDNLGFEVCSTAHNCEWLYDLCWCEKDDNGQVLNMPLAMECEWHTGFDHLLGDFQKLLVARADHRVFLCGQEPEDWADCVGQLIEQVCSYGGTRIGDRYLFGSWTEDGWKFQQYIAKPARPQANERVWLFQANSEYVLTHELKRRKTDYWHVVRYRDYLQPGNVVLFWQAGEDGGIMGVGELTSSVYESKEGGETEWCVDMRYKGLLRNPLCRSTAKVHPILQDLSILKTPFAANPFRVDEAQWQVIQEMITYR
jgi:hypothetical protein